MTSIKASEKELRKIFNNDYRFQIPKYQRPYAWTTEEVEELLKDLEFAIDRSKEEPYFLGSIVLIKQEDEPLAEVVDGQQRLTTLTILLCVLCELIQDKNNNIKGYIKEEDNQYENITGDYRLTLREQDCSMFREKVQSPDKLRGFINSNDKLPDSQSRIRENARLLWNELEKWGLQRQKDLVSFLVRRCYLVVVHASNQEAAYRIFSVMNNRGLDLSATDILKAEIIGKIEKNMQNDYASKWENIEEDLGREDFSKLFAHIRMIFCKRKAQGTLTQEFREDVLKNHEIDSTQFIDRYLDPLSKAYCIISRAAYESIDNPEAVNRPLKRLRQIDNIDWIPPAMAFYNKYTCEGEYLASFLENLDRLAFVMLVVRWNVNRRIDRYSEILNEIDSGADLSRETSKLQLEPEEKKQALEALDGPIYLQSRIVKPVLLRLDELSADEGAEYDRKVVSVEHVLPQNPGEDSDWLRWFPGEEQRDKWSHKLANLVLLSRRKNTQASNFDFEKKKKEYFKIGNVAPFAITTEVIRCREWTPDVLEKRQQELVNRLANEYRL